MGELIMYNLSKSSKKVGDLSVGDSVIVYAKGLPYQTKMCIDECDTGLEYVFYTTDTIRQWVYRDGNGLYKTTEQLIDECYVDCATDDELYERLEYIEHLQVEPLNLKDENSIVWLYTNDVDLYELNGVLYLLADELSEDVCVINI